MLRVAICDDEQIIREEIVCALNEYSRLRNIDIICDQYESGYDFLHSKILYHAVLLDYQLDKDIQLNGLSVARVLRSINNDIAIIFLTNFPKVVFSSFEVDAFRFLVKPLNKQKLFKTFDAFLKTLETDMTLMIRLEGAVSVISTKHIIYLEGDGKYCTIHMDQTPQDIGCHETLASVEQRLPDHLFFRCHRSFIVNLKHIQSYDHQEVVLRNGARASMSRKRYDMFDSKFIDYSQRYGY